MLRTIFLDLDDVCNKYTMHVLRCVVGNHVRLDYSSFPAECGYNIVAAANLLGGTNYDSNLFWSKVTRQVWEKMPCSDILHWLVQAAVQRVGHQHVFIASSSVIDPDALAGKLEWIHRNMPSWIWRRYVFTEHKYLLAAPDALLIDDHQGNCEEFEAAGGHSILVPRPWNRLAEKDAREHVFNQMSFRDF